MNARYGELLKEANEQLKSFGVRISLYAKGNKLYMRAVVPDKVTGIPKQQHISTGLNIDEITRGKKKALELYKELQSGTFDWFNWSSKFSNTITVKPELTIYDWVEKHKEYYFTKRPNDPKTQHTYRNEYELPYLRLKPNLPLTIDTLIKAVSTTKPNSRTRKRYVLAYIILAKFADLPESSIRKLQDLKGNYNYSSANKRYIPTDTEILLYLPYFKEDIAWSYAYKALAIWGLRPHELYYIDKQSITDEGLVTLQLQCTANNTLSTGGKGNLSSRTRTIYPCYQNWFEEWNMKDLQLPEITGNNNSDIGNRITHAFSRFNIPFSPYCLRHAYAIRLQKLGFPETLAATIMGHDLTTHRNVYFRDRRYEQVLESFTLHKDKLIYP